MDRYRDFDPGDPLPSTWPDAMEDLLSTYVSPNFELAKQSSNVVAVNAGASAEAVTVMIEGSPRFAVTNKTATHPGGPASNLPIYVTGYVDTFSSSGGHETNTTTQEFAIKIGTPSGTGAEAISRKIGTCSWNGSTIIGLVVDPAFRLANMRTPLLSDTSLVRPEYGGMPPGACLAFAADVSPDGWLLCDGSAVNRTTYARLFAVISTIYGAGNETTTFNLPDLRGRVPVGVDGAGRLSANDALGQSGGAEKHTLTIGEMPVHGHDLPAGAGGSGSSTYDANVAVNSTSLGAVRAASNGGGQAHNNMQPYQIVNWLIKT